MIRKERFVIEGREVEIQQFGAIQGWKTLRQITSVIGPAIGKGSNADYGQAVDLLFMRLSESQMIGLLKTLTQFCFIEGRPVQFETDMAVGKFSTLLLKEVLRLNYEEFFFTVRDAIKELLTEGDMEEMMPQETTPPME